MKTSYEVIRVAVDVTETDKLSLFSADSPYFAENSGTEPYTLLLENVLAGRIPEGSPTLVEKLLVRGLTRKQLSELASTIVELLS